MDDNKLCEAIRRAIARLDKEKKEGDSAIKTLSIETAALALTYLRIEIIRGDHEH